MESEVMTADDLIGIAGCLGHGETMVYYDTAENDGLPLANVVDGRNSEILKLKNHLYELSKAGSVHLFQKAIYTTGYSTRFQYMAVGK